MSWMFAFSGIKCKSFRTGFTITFQMPTYFTYSSYQVRCRFQYTVCRGKNQVTIGRLCRVSPYKLHKSTQMCFGRLTVYSLLILNLSENLSNQKCRYVFDQTFFSFYS